MGVPSSASPRLERHDGSSDSRWLFALDIESIRTVPVNQSAGPFADDWEPTRVIVITFSYLLLWREFAKPIGGGHSAVHQEVNAGDEPAIRTHEQRAYGSDFVWSSGPLRRSEFDHVAVACAAWTGQFVFCQGRDDNARTDRVDSRTALAPNEPPRP